jgi:hypothetical protein
LQKLVRDRSLTALALRKRVSGGKPLTRKNFGEELGRRLFLTESLNVFRQSPLMNLDANRVLILDLEFLTELLTSGVYWSIFDSLPANRRETFRELWGRLFEIYAVDLLKQFYPEASRDGTLNSSAYCERAVLERSRSGHGRTEKGRKQEHAIGMRSAALWRCQLTVGSFFQSRDTVPSSKNEPDPLQFPLQLPLRASYNFIVSVLKCW